VLKITNNSILKRISKIFTNTAIIIPYLGRKGLVNWLSDKTYLKLTYYSKFKKKLNLENPQSFNEKLQWLKLYDRKPEYTKLADKYSVRSYIKEVISDEILIPLLGVYDKFDDINFDRLPDRFVIKCTHDSGGVIIYNDRNKLDINETRKKVNKLLRRNYYYQSREYCYKNIKPRIIIEQNINPYNDRALIDYKLMCFNGKVKCSFVCIDRRSITGLKVDIYDEKWNIIPVKRHCPNSGVLTPRPKSYNKMVEYAEILSRNIPFLRVDFYEVNGKPYFGEITFYPGSGFIGFIPEQYDYILGDWIKLPCINTR